MARSVTSLLLLLAAGLSTRAPYSCLLHFHYLIQQTFSWASFSREPSDNRSGRLQNVGFKIEKTSGVFSGSCWIVFLRDVLAFLSLFWERGYEFRYPCSFLCPIGAKREPALFTLRSQAKTLSIWITWNTLHLGDLGHSQLKSWAHWLFQAWISPLQPVLPPCSSFCLWKTWS